MKTGKRPSQWMFLLVLLSVILGLGAWWSWAWWRSASAPPAPANSDLAVSTRKPIRFEVAPGTPSQHIGKDLESDGMIHSAFAWNLWSRWLSLQDSQGGFQAGTYELSPTQSLPDIAQKIWLGQTVQTRFTIPEGWSLRQMALYFEQQGFFKAKDFLAAASRTPQDRYSWLPKALPHLEGFLYPDTYVVSGSQITPEAVIGQMLDRFEQLALPLYRQQAKPQFSLLEWVTLASIIEKEAVIASERSRIAGVFVQRLKRGMPLGADPTVEYGLNIRQTPDRPLTLAQINTSSPYNTYLRAGLPPTPIASPGIASLKAALNPENTPYLYFVARYDGTHIFSRTLQEHEAAQAVIQDGRAAQRASQKKSQPTPSSKIKDPK